MTRCDDGGQADLAVLWALSPLAPGAASDHFGLSIRDRLDLVRLALTPEARLEGLHIDEFFRSGFFVTEFWLFDPYVALYRRRQATHRR